MFTTLLSSSSITPPPPALYFSFCSSLYSTCINDVLGTSHGERRYDDTILDDDDDDDVRRGISCLVSFCCLWFLFGGGSTFGVGGVGEIWNYGWKGGLKRGLRVSC